MLAAVLWGREVGSCFKEERNVSSCFMGEMKVCSCFVEEIG